MRFVPLLLRIGTLAGIFAFSPEAAPASDRVEPGADGDGGKAATANDDEAPKPGVAVEYGEDGLEIRASSGNYLARFTLRAQLRATYPFPDDPQSLEEFGDLDESEEIAFAIDRARFKWGGHAYRPWLDYYLEYDLVGTQLLDLRFTFEKWEAANFRIGQWKAEYNRERRDSSGEQQFVERSIANLVFTLDRQSGFMASGRLFEGRAFDSHYWAGVFSGAGLGELGQEGQPMYVGRWQWNFTRRELGFSQSDIERKREPHGSFAVAAARNRSRFTRFSSSGGGELEGFPSDLAERYDVEQAVVEAAFQQAGFSFQAEAHRKEIEDRLGTIGDAGISVFDGGYAQAGYFFHELWQPFPAPLELALRYARVDATDAPDNGTQTELTAGANWFFHGHRNKLTADISRLEVEEPAGSADEIRFRLQWDVSF